MKVYKFGGASVRTSEGVKNLAHIVGLEQQPVFIIVSAMGKTTNALEAVTDHFIHGDRKAALDAVGQCAEFHRAIIEGLLPAVPDAVTAYFTELGDIINNETPVADDYDLWYDRLVSYGEMISTTIISEYLSHAGLKNQLLDMRRLYATTGRHRDAVIDLEGSARLMDRAMDHGSRIFIGQGFIGVNDRGEVTTLGREGSDYSAAAAAYMLNAQSVTIWKDVDGILNADPKIFPDTVLIPELSYLDAIELAYSGAQIIHPKTIKPLENKGIPLYVRPFGDTAKGGSVIGPDVEYGSINVPILILKRDQVLLSIRPQDFSFVLEERFAEIFSLLDQCGIRINLIQSSAVNLTVCIDSSRNLDKVTESLRACGFRAVFNGSMELLTIRGYNDALHTEYSSSPEVFLSQRTRRIMRIVRKSTAR